MEELKDKKRIAKPKILGGCALPIGIFCVFLLICVTLFLLVKTSSSEHIAPRYINNAVKTLDKKADKLARKESTQDTKKTVYDIDNTIKALFSIEQAMSSAKNFEELTSLIVHQDSDNVAPDVLELKRRFFKAYQKLLDARDKYDEINSIYNITTGSMLDLASSVDYLNFNLDHNQTMRVWDKRLQEGKIKEKILDRISEHKDELIDFYFDYMKTTSQYYKEWNMLCSYRDRAYLAMFENDWDEAFKNSYEAVKLSPSEKEAHIIMIMSLLERNNETDLAVASKFIEDFIAKNQGQEAPGWLLRGVLNLKNKNYDKALLDFEQAAVYYPKQQEVLLDKVNLYKKRNFLNKSKEGRIILNIYWGIMSGSGYFSPDFQIARINMENGDMDKARKKIFDHFFRRRMQGQWDKVLADFQYSSRFLKTALHEINKDMNTENLEVEINPAFFTNSVILSIKNNSPRDLHNITILLCVRFTDMFKGDYISFPVGETTATLKSGETMVVGRQNISDITKDKLGSVKKFKDIIDYAAVIVSDELISWIDAKPAAIQKETANNIEQFKTKLSLETVRLIEKSYKDLDLVQAAKNPILIDALKKITNQLLEKSSLPQDYKQKLSQDEFQNELINDMINAASEIIKKNGNPDPGTDDLSIKAQEYFDKTRKYFQDKFGTKTEIPPTNSAPATKDNNPPQ